MPEPTILPLTADPGDPDRLALDREEPRAAPDAAGRNTGVVIGRDALGNVFVTGDGNTVEVKLTVVVADARLQAAEAAVKGNPYRGLDAFRETDSAVFFGRDDLIRRLWSRFTRCSAIRCRACSPF
jgi:hypothetical protein